MPEEDQIRPVNAAGDYIDGRVGIDDAHRRGVMHKGVWLHVLTLDNHLLLLRRSPSMATCAGGLSIVGEHSWLGESDERCARRALREELPSLARAAASAAASLHPLRAVPRWFLYDYPDDLRRDRALISEWLLSLSINGTQAQALLRQQAAVPTPTGQHAEASEMRFVTIAEYARRLLQESHSFCAPGLLPSALVDSVADICHVLRTKGPAPEGCGAVLAWRRHDRLRGAETALQEDFDQERTLLGIGHTPWPHSAPWPQPHPLASAPPPVPQPHPCASAPALISATPLRLSSTPSATPLRLSSSLDFSRSTRCTTLGCFARAGGGRRRTPPSDSCSGVTAATGRLYSRDGRERPGRRRRWR